MTDLNNLASVPSNVVHFLQHLFFVNWPIFRGYQKKGIENKFVGYNNTYVYQFTVLYHDIFMFICIHLYLLYFLLSIKTSNLGFWGPTTFYQGLLLVEV